MPRSRWAGGWVGEWVGVCVNVHVLFNWEMPGRSDHMQCCAQAIPQEPPHVAGGGVSGARVCAITGVGTPGHFELKI